MPRSAVSNPSYIPKRFSLTPAAFGQVPEIEWLPLDPATRYVALASKVQHATCFAIWAAIKTRYGTVADFIRASDGQITDQFRRALRGDAVLQPRDLAYVIDHFGEGLALPNPQDVLRSAVD